MTNFRFFQSFRATLKTSPFLAGAAFVSGCASVALIGASSFGAFDQQTTESAKASLASLFKEPSLSALSDSLLRELKDVAKYSPEPNSVDSMPVFERDLVLLDYKHKVSDEFDIPPSLRDRVGFWFDVYTKYDSTKRIIHHGLFPWIKFKVVDTSGIVNNDSPRFLWMRVEKANKVVKEEARKIREALRSVAKKGANRDLNEYEQMVVAALSSLGDQNIRKAAAKAANEVRVQTGQRDFFVNGLIVSSRYLGTMEEIFREHRLPIELTRIPFVESSFNKKATSKVGASGIWQFMDGTGSKFMHVSDLIDERRSPLKSTLGAARLLKENHMILYRSWPLAITAWNHGPGGVRRASQAARSRDLAVIISKYRSRSFDFASSNFYSEFLAALHAERYNEEVFGSLEREAPLQLQAVRVPRAIRVQDIVRSTGLTLEDFLALNPDLKRAARQNARIPAGFKLHLPPDAKLSVERLFADNGSRRKKNDPS